MSHFFKSLVAAAVVGGSVLVGSTAALAVDIESYLDSHYDNGTTYDPRGDIDGVSAVYDDGTVGVLLRTRMPVDPATDDNWVYNNTGIIWMLDVDGDSIDDYWVGLVNNAGPSFAVTPPGDASTIICDGNPYFGSNGFIVVRFERTCIGSPVGFQMRAYHRYGWATSTSEDYAPSDGSYCCTVFAATEPQPDPEVTTAGTESGYWMITDNGEVSAFGDAKHYGNEIATTVKQVDIEPTPSGNGYWILAESGAVHAKGDARSLGSALNTLSPGEKAAALSSMPAGDGYWIFTDRGRVLAFGTARHFGDMSGVTLNGPVLDAVATPAGEGYWMVASDGGVFTFGNAKFYGSTGNLKLNQPVMSMAPDPDGSGYWLVASDGGIFAFEAGFYGSMGATPLNKPISGIVPGRGGYMMVGEDGGIFAFGNVAFHGSLGANPPARPVVAVALMS